MTFADSHYLINLNLTVFCQILIMDCFARWPFPHSHDMYLWLDLWKRIKNDGDDYLYNGSDDIQHRILMNDNIGFSNYFLELSFRMWNKATMQNLHLRLSLIAVTSYWYYETESFVWRVVIKTCKLHRFTYMCLYVWYDTIAKQSSPHLFINYCNVLHCVVLYWYW